MPKAESRAVITLGDACGIGPEVILKSLARKRELLPHCILVGDPTLVKRDLYRFGLTHRIRVMAVDSFEVARRAIGVLLVLGRPHPGLRKLKPGRENALAGKMAAAWLKTGVDLVCRGAARSLVTGPVSKAAVARTHPGFRGHTEFIARAAKVREPVMMLAGPTLRVVPATRHVPLRKALAELNTGLLVRTIATTVRGLRRWFGIGRPRIAVCGVNPHAGEGGLLGHEDRRIVAPAVRRAAKGGMRVTGPVPADTVFAAARKGLYDAVVTAYHDQAMIPVKTVELDATVNVTLGLPFLRTSPAHGTAFDIAGKGKADPGSMLAAIEMGVAAAHRRG